MTEKIITEFTEEEATIIYGEKLMETPIDIPEVLEEGVEDVEN